MKGADLEENFSEFNNVFCDSLEALDWAYQHGLSREAKIYTCSPAMLWDEKKNIYNIEARWTAHELKKFQSSIKKLTEDIFDAALEVPGVERELAITISQTAYQFQKTIYKAACLGEKDFTDSRLFIYADGKTGAMGNIMNSPWEGLLASNPLFSMVSYTLKNPEFK